MKFSKIALCSTVTVLLSTCLPGFAESDVNAPYSLPSYTVEEALNSANGIIVEESKSEAPVKKITLTSNEAVQYGLEHSDTLKTLDKKLDLATITLIMTNENKSEIQDAQEKIDAAQEVLYSNNLLLSQAQTDLNNAQTALNAGLTPIDLPLVDAIGAPLVDVNGNPITITKGTHIRTALGTLPSPALPSPLADALAAGTIASIQATLDGKQAEINSKSAALQSASETLSLKEKEFNSVLSDVSDSLGMKLQNSSNVVFTADEASDLMVTMAGVNLDITRYAKRIYRNQIAMLIQKEYNDALLADKKVLLKQKAEQRGKVQYDLTKLSYDNGMKSNQDLLLSKMYYNSTQIATRVALSEYKNAMYQLKKELGLNYDCELTLVEPVLSSNEVVSLEEALKSGTTNRIEIQKCLGQLQITKLNFSLLEKRPSNLSDGNAAMEARLQMEQAELALNITKDQVTSEICQSYENLMAMQDGLVYAEDLIKDATDAVSIAKLKYEQGFGADNALLQSLNIESSSGTIVELIATEEKLLEIEEKVATLKYNYIMAKIKYYNDAALLSVLEN